MLDYQILLRHEPPFGVWINNITRENDRKDNETPFLGYLNSGKTDHGTQKVVASESNTALTSVLVTFSKRHPLARIILSNPVDVFVLEVSLC